MDIRRGLKLRLKLRLKLPLNVLLNLLLVSPLALALAGCATHRVLDHAAVDAELRMGTPGLGTGGGYTGGPLRFPLRLGIVHREPETRPDATHAMRWSPNEIDPGRLEPLLRAGLVSEVVELPGHVPASATLADLRATAREQGVDAVLVLDAAGDTVRNTNKWAWTYLTIVGGWLVPGSRADCLAVVRGTLWGLDGGAPYTTVTAEGEAFQLAPAFLLDSDKVMREARGMALDQFFQELGKAMRRVADIHGNPRLRARSNGR
ncbi:MAG: hypothetical protein OEW11_11435 [Nitrospirota bacterium]|nr:hypothetical protein [Nitrospirota bacterium]